MDTQQKTVLMLLQQAGNGIKPIVGYEGKYLVTDKGEIYSITRIKPVKMNFFIGTTGYYFLKLFKDGRYKSLPVHRFVAKAFIDNPHKKPFVNHIDANKLNNDVVNLEWCTPKENSIHAYHLGLVKLGKGEDHRSAKLNKNKVRAIRKAKLENPNYPTKKLAEKYGVSTSTINFVLSGKYWREIA